ncbi:MAG: serine protease, partial [Sedimentisphaerales bacterium]|nr:serine protease [Sedimentisphaerales bacterium]
MAKTWLLVSTILYLMFGAVSSVRAGAERIFKSVSSSVVLIRDFESHGSGVVLDNKGKILTNYHIVNTPLPLEVTAEVIKGGRRVSMTFSEVTVENVHKDYDLATIRVKLPAGVYLEPIETTSRTPEPG